MTQKQKKKEPRKKIPHNIKREIRWARKEIRTSECEWKNGKSFIRHRIASRTKKKYTKHNEKDLNISLANAENVGDEKYSVFHGKDNIK